MRILLLGGNCEGILKLKEDLENCGHSVDHFKELYFEKIYLKVVSYCIAIIVRTKKWKINHLKLLKNKIDIPVLVLNEEYDVNSFAEMLYAGADDCMRFPYDIQELNARLYVICRRIYGFTDSIWRFGDYCFDPVAKVLTKEENVITLTRCEISVLEVLLMYRNKIVSIRTIEDKLYPWDKVRSSNTVQVYISGLRKKLDHKTIITIPGFGYKLNVKEN